MNMASPNKKKFSIFLILLLYCLGRTLGQNYGVQEHSYPILVHVLFRHGDRTPVFESIYPEDPHKNETYLPFGLGNLTPLGKKRMFKLGKFIRKRYDKLFSHSYMPEMLRAYSSDTDRTKMSLQLVLAGLLPPRDVEVWNEDLDWQPIPYDTLKLDQDKIFSGMSSCPNYVKLYKEFSMSEEIVNLHKKNEELLQYLSENTGANVTSFLSVTGVYFCLLSELDWGLELPEWTKKVYPDELERITIEQYRIYSGTTELIKLSSGYLLKKILEDTKQKINGTLPEERKTFLYSGHEINMASVLHSLGVYDNEIPGYGSAVFIELHRIKGKIGIQVVYRNNDKKPKLLTLPGCDKFCPWEKFVNLIGKYLPSESSCGDPVT